MNKDLHLSRSLTLLSLFPFGLLLIWSSSLGTASYHDSNTIGSNLVVDTIPTQMAVPGSFMPPYEYLNDIPPGGLDLNGDQVIDIITPCSCRQPLTIDNGDDTSDGLFNDQLIVATGVSGQTWRIETIANAFNRVNLQPILPGTILPEVGNTGIYVLPIVHKSENGYYAFAFAPNVNPNLLLGPVTSTCYFPKATIENLEETYCNNAPPINLVGTATTAFDDHITLLSPEQDYWLIERLEDGMTFPTNIFNPTTLGAGTYRISYTFDAGGPAFYAPNKTGCQTTAQVDVTVRAPQTMACNSNINITLPPSTCEVQVVPALLLAGTPESDELFDIAIIGPMGQNLGSTIPADYAGLPLIGDITDLCTGENCLTNIIVNDLAKPVLTVPPNITLSCTQMPVTSITGVATATDCSDFTVNYSDMTTQFTCGNPKVRITRTWVATDEFGNSNSGNQIININRATIEDFRFPSDVTFSCSDVLADPSITAPTADGAGIPNLVSEPNCGLIYVHEDDTISLCGNPMTSYVVLRSWSVLDICGFQPIGIDGAGNDNLQLIRVLDETGPTISADPFAAFANLSQFDNGLSGCSSTGFIPPPSSVTDGCNAFKLTILTPIGEADYVNGSDGSEGGYIPFPGLPIGIHNITYRAEDNCGNISSQMVQVTVVDNMPPIMICNSMLSLTLSASGSGRIFPENIDEGSRDDCCEGDMKIKLLGESDAAFRYYIDFFCDNDTIDVVLRSWDCYGNFNECIAEVLVLDLVPPILAAGVDDVVLTCQDDYSSYLDSSFDAPIFDDNCDFTVSFEIDEQLDDCGAGVLSRTWTARDNAINTPATFTQQIILEAVHDYRFYVPSDTTVDCGVSTYANVQILDTACDLLDVTVDEEIVSLPEDTSCFKVIRTHRIMNWCEYDGQSDPVEIPRWDGFDLNTLTGDGFVVRSDGVEIYRETPSLNVGIGNSIGYYTYRQIITIYDDEPSTATAIGPTSFCVPEDINLDSCFAVVDFPVDITDNCTDSVEVIHSLYLNNESIVADFYGDLIYGLDRIYRVRGNYPLGDHAFIFTLFDDCGNFSEYYLPFSVEDCHAPELECPATFEVEVPIAQSISLDPASILLSMGDNCGIATIAFDSTFTQLSRTFDCDDLGTLPLQIWARDASGNRSSCSFTAMVTDNDNTCTGLFDITGLIKTESGQPVGQTKIRLLGPEGGNQTTAADGLYAFLERPEGGPYSVSATKDIGHGNGVTVLDLILTTRHIIGVGPLDSPYKVIAADTDRSNSVTVADLINMRRLILSLDTVFQNNTSWRMVPELHVFDNPTNPLNEMIPESYTISQLSSDTIIDFIGVKIGDIDGSAMPANLQQVEVRNYDDVVLLDFHNTYFEKGQMVRIPFRLEASDIAGIQVALTIDPKLLGNTSILPGGDLGLNDFNLKEIDKGKIQWCWAGMETVEYLEFELQGIAKTAFWAKELCQISAEILPAVCYLEGSGGFLTENGIRLNAVGEGDKLADMQIFQNYPNPFFSKTNINFYLAQECEVQIDIFDTKGNIINQRHQVLSAGLQHIIVDRAELDAPGIYFYRLQTAFGMASGRMLLIE